MVGGRRRCGPGGHLRGPGEPPLQGLRSARGCLARPTTYGRCPYPGFDARCANERDEAGRVVSPGLAAAIAEVPQEVHTAGLPAGLEDGLLAGVDKARLAARGGPRHGPGSGAPPLRAGRRRSRPSARRSKPGSADIKTARFVHSHRAQAGKACSVIRPRQKGRTGYSTEGRREPHEGTAGRRTRPGRCVLTPAAQIGCL